MGIPERSAAPAPLVDVGIPAHGRPRFLAEAIESVLAQTTGAWRLRVCEDGPGSAAIRDAVEPYLSDVRVTYEPAGAKIGAAAVMTRLIRSGEAPFVALLHDDDRWGPRWIEDRVAFLEVHPECGFVFSANDEIDEAGRRIARIPAKLGEGVHPSAEFVPMLLKANPVGTPTVLVRREAYDAAGPAFDARFPSIYDYEMWLRIAIRFPVGYLARWDADYRVHGGQVTVDVHGGRAEERLRFLEHAGELVAAVPELGLRPPVGDDDMRARILLSKALDDIQAGQRGDALAALREAVRRRPSAAWDSRVPAALAGLAAGRAGARALGAARGLVGRKRLRVHLRRPR
jgi:hypothetical protein